MFQRVKKWIYQKPFLCALAKLLANRKDQEYLDNFISFNPKFYFEKEKMCLSRGKTFYITDEDWDICGFFGIMRFCLLDLCVADSMGFIPYVNITNSIYNVSGGWNGTDNMYEYYFLQTTSEKLDRIIAEENYFMSNSSIRNGIRRNFSADNDYEFDEQQLHYMGSVARKYMRLRPELEVELRLEIDSLLKGKKTIGIHYRGSDYKVGLKEHPAALTVEQYFPFIDEAFMNGFEQIFLATDDVNAYKMFCDQYKGRIVSYNDVMRTEGLTGVHLMEHEREEQKYYLGREVLRDMMTLSCCDGFIAGMSNVSMFTRIWRYRQNKEFEYIQIISRGLNKKNTRDGKKYLATLGR